MFAQVTLLSASGVTADHQVNGFAADAVSFGNSDLDDWKDVIKAFYDACDTLGGMRGIAQNNHVVKFYDITNPPPNYPLYETTFNRAAGAVAIDLPMELALAVSYADTLSNAVPRARRRGRIYVSGWAESTNTTGRPSSTLYEGLSQAYADYALALNTLGVFTAGVWSRVNNVVYPIDTVWCDNEWDIQRRRGGKATARDTINI